MPCATKSTSLILTPIGRGCTASADSTLAGVVEQGLEEMLDEDRDIALANQGARERWCAGVRDWLSREGVAV